MELRLKKKIFLILFRNKEGGVESKLICTKVLIIHPYNIMCYDLNSLGGEDWVNTGVRHEHNTCFQTAQIGYPVTKWYLIL